MKISTFWLEVGQKFPINPPDLQGEIKKTEKMANAIIFTFYLFY